MPNERRDREQVVKMTFSLPLSLARDMEELLVNPLHGRFEHGARSTLVTALLRSWCDQQLADSTKPFVLPTIKPEDLFR